MDIVAGNVDTMMTNGQPGLAQKYFGRGVATDKRIAAEMRKLGLSKQQRSTFERELATALGAEIQE